MRSIVVQVCLPSLSCDSLDDAAAVLGVTRSAIVREVVESWLADPEGLERLRSQLDARRQAKRQERLAKLEASASARSPGRPPKGPARPVQPWLADPDWIRAKLVRLDPSLAQADHDRLREVAARGDVPAALAAAWAAEHPDAPGD